MAETEKSYVLKAQVSKDLIKDFAEEGHDLRRELRRYFEEMIETEIAVWGLDIDPKEVKIELEEI